MGKGNILFNHLLSIVWLLILILPNSLYFYIFVPISILLLYKQKKIESKIWIPIQIIILSLLFTLLLNSNKGYIENKDIFRVIEIIILLFTFSQLKGEKILKPYIYFAIFYLVISQFAFLLNINFMINLIYNYYPYEGDKNMYGFLEGFEVSNIGIRGLGGIYYNSNQYARYLELVLLVLLCEINQFRKNEIFILFSIIIISIVASGSRTSFLVLSLTTLFYLYLNNKLSVRNFLLIIFIAGPFIWYLFSYTSIGDFRMFKIDEGMDNSFGEKVYLFSEYLQSNHNILPLLWGNLSGMILMEQYGFDGPGTDFEFGNIPVLYGFIFLFLLFIFYFAIYQATLRKYKILFVILLWMFTSSIISSYRMAPLWIMVLGLYYRRSLVEKQIIYNNGAGRLN